MEFHGHRPNAGSVTAVPQGGARAFPEKEINYARHYLLHDERAWAPTKPDALNRSIFDFTTVEFRF